MTNYTKSGQKLIKITVRKIGSLLFDLGVSLREWAMIESKPITPTQSEKIPKSPLALVAGYFSFKDGYATFGDTEAMDITCEWLSETGIRYDIACHYSNGVAGLSLAELDSSRYDIFIFVCGPWKENNNNILEKFDHCLKIGVNLSIEDINSNRFDLLYSRDLPGLFNPDIVFSSKQKDAPLIGICLVHPQAEYGERQRHMKVNSAVEKYLSEHNISYIYIDTLHRDNKCGITNAKNFENLLSRLDVVISSRLHGMVFSLKNETPVVAIDAIAGGAKLTKQAKALGWPVVIDGDQVDSNAIADAVNTCLEESSKQMARCVKKQAQLKIHKIERQFKNDLLLALEKRKS